MKRSAYLAPLSRDHHHVLVTALALTRSGEADANPAARRFRAFFDEEVSVHFGIEEAPLLPAVPDDERGRELIQRVLSDPEQVRVTAAALRDAADPPRPEMLRDLGVSLRAHFALEQQELVSLLESTLPLARLETLGEQLAAAERDAAAAVDG